MSSIQSVSGQPYIASQAVKASSGTKTESCKIETDQFFSGDTVYDRTEEKTAPFTAEMASKLAQEYDVRNLSRNAYTKLLVQLRDSGVLTAREYSAAYGGAMPAHTQGISWPLGSETRDFTLFLQECKQQCSCAAGSEALSGDEERGNCEMLASVYSKLDGIVRQIHSAREQETAVDSLSPAREYSDEFKRLYKLLEQDESYVERARKLGSNFDRRHPIRIQAIKEYLLSNPQMLEDFAKHQWILDVEYNAGRMKYYAEHPNRKLDGFRNVPPDYTSYVNQYRHTLMYGSEMDVYDLSENFERSFLGMKFSRTQRLTDEERLLFPVAADYERAHWQNFDERMAPVGDAVREGFDRAGLSLDIDKEYRFYLDTQNFTFSVDGGTEEENRLMADIINTNPRASYVFNPLKTTIYALYFHRQTDYSYTPWRTKGLSAEEIEKFGIADISESYTRKMKQFLAAYRRSVMDKDLQFRFGFGIDDISYVDGHWRGSTDAITRTIEEMNWNATWDKQIGDAYRELMREYTGTPVFTEAVFVFQNGEFRVTYEEPSAL